MISRKYPHYYKLRYILNEKQLELYKKITPSSYIHSLFDFNSPIQLMKATETVVVFGYKKNVIKLIFRKQMRFQNEVFFSHLLYEDDILSLAVPEACLLILPRHSTTLREREYMSDEELHDLKSDLVKQICSFHCESVVHHDIKPSNIVIVNKNASAWGTKKGTPRLNWKIIDYGLTGRHPQEDPGYMPFQNGTSYYNIPRYDFTDEHSEDDKLFWLYMKDWYGFTRTLIEKEDIDKYVSLLTSYIESMNKPAVLTILNEIVKKFNVIDLPYYLHPLVL